MVQKPSFHLIEGSIMKKRNINIDVLKCIAVVFVISVHFFLHTNYYGRSFGFKSIFYSSFIWIIFMTCVPLFLMVTGYLMKDKTYSKSYFLKLLPVIGTYILTASVYTLFNYKALNIEYLEKLVANIVTFSHYAWYVNMYIGLYLLIPLLNVGYKSLNNHRSQALVILILIVLTVLPPSFSLLNNNQKNIILQHLVPDYWKGIWPVTFYFLGIFLASLNKKWDIKMVILSIIIVDVLSIVGIAGVSENSLGVEFSVLPVLLLSSLIYYLVLHLRIDIKKIWLQKIIYFISKNTLSIYLFSVIGDNYWYPKFIEKWGDFSNILPKFPLIVFLLSLQSLFITFLLTSVLKYVQIIFNNPKIKGHYIG